MHVACMQLNCCTLCSDIFQFLNRTKCSCQAVIGEILLMGMPEGLTQMLLHLL